MNSSHYIICLLLLMGSVIGISAQEAGNNWKEANEFPEFIQPDIPGAPELSKPILIMGQSKPVMGEGMGWAAPAAYDINKDGKKDLLIGEFGSGLENTGKGGKTGHHVRVYLNQG